MCHFLRLLYHCSHWCNTKALVLCHNPHSCDARDIVRRGRGLLDRLDETLFPDSSICQLRLTNILCDQCLNKVSKGAQRQQTKISELCRKVQDLQLELHNAQEQANSEARKAKHLQRIATAETRRHHDDDRSTAYYHRRPLSAPARMHTLCASGRCSNQVVVGRDGRSGEFCRQHTCSARDWGCLQDAHHNPLGVKRSAGAPRFCPAHTCCVTGCGARVSGSREGLCRMHGYLKGDARALSIMIRGRRATTRPGTTA